MRLGKQPILGLVLKEISPLRPTRGGTSRVMGLEVVSGFLGAVPVEVFAKPIAQCPMQPKEGNSTRAQHDTGANWGIGPTQKWASES